MGTILLNNFIEHTILKENLREEEIVAHIKEAIELEVLAVCVSLPWVSLTKKEIKNAKLKIVTVIDFPLGQKSPEEKGLEALAARSFGADELDMVIDFKAIKNKDYQLALDGIKAVVKNAKKLPVKVIVETSALTQAELAIACCLVSLGHADFIKTSTGFHKAGAQIDDVRFIRSLLPKNIGIKASGGIKTRDFALNLIKAGADRIGTSTAKKLLLSSDRLRETNADY